LLVLSWLFQRDAVPDEEQVDFQLGSSQATILTADSIAYEAEEIIQTDNLKKTA